MAQAKKKQATKTAKKQTRKTTAKKNCRTLKCDNSERNHIYIVTVMGIITALLLCANVAMMLV